MIARLRRLAAVLGLVGAGAAAALVLVLREPTPTVAAAAVDTADASGESALRGALPVPGLWAAYKERFVTPEGRVIDDVSGGVSHSESQGYGLILALAADDADGFRRIWTWTRANLYLRKDGLASWRWQPGPVPNVRDPNNATDGDLLVAWALIEAGEAWKDPALTLAGRRIARAVWTETVVDSRWGRVLLPGVTGFKAGERKDGPVVNPSYWIFPALGDLARRMPDLDWPALARSGEKIVAEARIGPSGLPPEWASLAGEKIVPAEGFAPTFGYNAVRVPLYLAWGQGFRRDRLAPFMARWSQTDKPALHVVDLPSGRDLEPFVEPGYRAVAALVACTLEGTRFPQDLRGTDVDHYYPTTLRALALVAVNMRHPTCW